MVGVYYAIDVPQGRIGLSRDLPSQPAEHFRLHFEHHTGARQHPLDCPFRSGLP